MKTSLSINILLYLLIISGLSEAAVEEELYLSGKKSITGNLRCPHCRVTQTTIESIQQFFPEAKKPFKTKEYWKRAKLLSPRKNFIIPIKVEKKYSYKDIIVEAKKEGTFYRCLYAKNRDQQYTGSISKLDEESDFKFVVLYTPRKTDNSIKISTQSLLNISENHPLLYVVQRSFNESSRRKIFGKNNAYNKNCPPTWSEAVKFIEFQKKSKNYDHLLAKNIQERKNEIAREEESKRIDKLNLQRESAGFINGNSPEWFNQAQSILGIEVDTDVKSIEKQLHSADTTQERGTWGFMIKKVNSLLPNYTRSTEVNAGDILWVGFSRNPYEALEKKFKSILVMKDGSWENFYYKQNPGKKISNKHFTFSFIETIDLNNIETKLKVEKANEYIAELKNYRAKGHSVSFECSSVGGENLIPAFHYYNVKIPKEYDNYKTYDDTNVKVRVISGEPTDHELRQFQAREERNMVYTKLKNSRELFWKAYADGADTIKLGLDVSHWISRAKSVNTSLHGLFGTKAPISIYEGAYTHTNQDLYEYLVINPCSPFYLESAEDFLIAMTQALNITNETERGYYKLTKAEAKKILVNNFGDLWDYKYRNTVVQITRRKMLRQSNSRTELLPHHYIREIKKQIKNQQNFLAEAR